MAKIILYANEDDARIVSIDESHICKINESISIDDMIKEIENRFKFEDDKTLMNEIINETHRYYPDIYIKSENQVVEVKSTYTFNKEK